MARSRDLFGFWQGLLRVVGSFGDCPRCLAVCPVGNDYHAYLAEAQKAIPERTPEKVALGKAWKERRAAGDKIAGLDDWNVRWVGPDRYKGIVARQLQEFKRMQQCHADPERGKAATAEAGGMPVSAAIYKEPIAQERRFRWMKAVGDSLPHAVSTMNFPEASEIIPILELGLNQPPLLLES